MSSAQPTSTFSISRQKTPTSCGPTCLNAVYAWFERPVAVERLIEEIPSLPDGGTYAVYLGIDALRRGYKALIHSWNLHLLDPSWFPPKKEVLLEKLSSSRAYRKGKKERKALEALETYIELGGEISMEPLTRELLRRHLIKGRPVLTGLSSTFLYQQVRQIPSTGEDNDLEGEPEGHFVVCHGYNRAEKKVTVHDPYPNTPFPTQHRYEVHIDRLINAILLGVLTYDANLLVISPVNDPHPPHR
jgi:hypothetical protein